MLTVDIVQTVLLAINAGLFWWYLRETKSLRLAAEEQVESSSLPAIVAKFEETSGRPVLFNIGNGPAIELEWSVSDVADLKGTFSYLEPHRPTSDLCAQSVFFAVAEARNAVDRAVDIKCKYRSLSGKTYYSRNVYDPGHQRFAATFQH